jgi:hypothetical protein
MRAPLAFALRRGLRAIASPEVEDSPFAPAAHPALADPFAER